MHSFATTCFSAWFVISLYVLNSIQITLSVALSDAEATIIRDKIVEEHNKYRKLHQASNLTIDKNLNNDAQGHVQELANEDVLRLKKDNEFGENHWRNEDDLDLKKIMNGTSENNPVEYWYNQSKDYMGSYRSDYSKEVGFFTQLVWVNTKYLGCGFANSSKFKYVVCFYNPPGNVRAGEQQDTLTNYLYNVLPGPEDKWPENKAPMSSWWYLPLIFVFPVIIFGWRYIRRRQRRRPSTQ